jgi:cation transport ATPase
MGIGSFYGKRILTDDIVKRIGVICVLIVFSGIILFILYPFVLNNLLIYSQLIRSIVTFFMMIPFGFLLGIPFPSAIELLKHEKIEKYIPWMYGINGTMSVLGSVIAVVITMIWGFSPSFFAGLLLYLIIFLATILKTFSLRQTNG